MRNHPATMIRCTPAHLLYLAENARPDEIEQYVKLTGLDVYDPRALASYFWNERGPKFTLIGRDGMPAIAGGYINVDEGVWQSFLVGTLKGWETDWRSITKAALWMIEAMFEVGAKRLETYVLSSRTKAIEWYERSLKLSLDDSYQNDLAKLYTRTA